MKTLTSIVVAALCVFPSAIGQQSPLYLITGTSAGNNPATFQTAVVSVGLNGSIRIDKELTSNKVGAQWITTDYDARKAVILSKEPENHVIVFDFDSASVSKSCADPDGSLLVDRWLVDSPSHGTTFVGYGKSPSTGKIELLGMELDSSAPCQDSFTKIDAAEVNYFVSDGAAGVADYRSFDQMYVVLGTDGGLSRKLLDGEQTQLRYNVPPKIFADMQYPVSSMIIINNRQIFGLLLSSPSERFLVFRKSDSTWHQVPDPSMGRAFGSFIASSEVHAQSSSTIRESSGKAEWRQTVSPTGPQTAKSIGGSRMVYPGTLHLYDVATEKSYTIITNQGDSEILLVENGAVYYRVSDRLYSAPLGASSVGAPTLLATGDLIRDAHWAFIKH